MFQSCMCQTGDFKNVPHRSCRSRRNAYFHSKKRKDYSYVVDHHHSPRRTCLEPGSQARLRHWRRRPWPWWRRGELWPSFSKGVWVWMLFRKEMLKLDFCWLFERCLVFECSAVSGGRHSPLFMFLPNRAQVVFPSPSQSCYLRGIPSPNMNQDQPTFFAHTDFARMKWRDEVEMIGNIWVPDGFTERSRGVGGSTL